MSKKISNVSSVLRQFIPVGLVISLIFLSVYAVTQQVLRQSANDPQIWMAEEIADSLARNKEAAVTFPSGVVDLETSVSPFIIFFGADGVPVSATARLGGVIPSIPTGVLAFAKTYNENRVTWQPQKGVREAVVVTYFKNSRTSEEGFVLVGRSLRDTEIRVDNISNLLFFSWLMTELLAFISSFIFWKKLP